MHPVIYDRTVNGRPINPGLALYRYWYSILVGQTNETTRNSNGHRRSMSAFGQQGWPLEFRPEGPVDKPVITYGYMFQLTHKGEFRLISPHGWKQRNNIAAHTFLAWNFDYSTYNWRVDLDARSGHHGGLRDWERPLNYIPESVLSTRNWSTDKPWNKLVWEQGQGLGQGQWLIKFSRNAEDTYGPNQNLTDPATYDAFDALRAKRYYRLQRRHMLDTGMWTEDAGRIVTTKERADDNQAFMQVILASMEIHQPAKTTPLRRDRKEDLWPVQPGCR